MHRHADSIVTSTIVIDRAAAFHAGDDRSRHTLEDRRPFHGRSAAAGEAGPPTWTTAKSSASSRAPSSTSIRSIPPTPASTSRTTRRGRQRNSIRAKLIKQQILLYAEHKHSILVVLQALDAGGKDGTIKHVFTALNPQGVQVASFKQPTPTELAHDFLWRVHPHAPGKGEIAIFNRSHYEDLLVTRVHKLIDKATWTTRYQRIRDFEALLRRERHHDHQVLSAHQQGGAARVASRSASTTRTAIGRSANPTTPNDCFGTTISRRSRTRSAPPARRSPWYVIPSNTSGSAISRCRRSWPTRWRTSSFAFPPPSVNLAAIRRKYHAAPKQEKGGKKA